MQQSNRDSRERIHTDQSPVALAVTTLLAPLENLARLAERGLFFLANDQPDSPYHDPSRGRGEVIDGIDILSRQHHTEEKGHSAENLKTTAFGKDLLASSAALNLLVQPDRDFGNRNLATATKHQAHTWPLPLERLSFLSQQSGGDESSQQLAVLQRQLEIQEDIRDALERNTGDPIGSYGE